MCVWWGQMEVLDKCEQRNAMGRRELVIWILRDRIAMLVSLRELDYECVNAHVRKRRPMLVAL